MSPTKRPADTAGHVQGGERPRNKQDIWEEYRTIALNKLPEEGGIRELYRDNWWEGPDCVGDDFECIPRLVKLLENHPDLSQRDIFAICQSRVANFDGSDVSNEPIVPMADKEEMRKRINAICITICKNRLCEEETSSESYDDHVPRLKRALKNAQKGVYENLDEIFELEGYMGATYLDAACRVAEAMDMEISSNGESETNPMIAWLIRTGFATIAVNSIADL